MNDNKCELSKIPLNQQYTGYLWLSDEQNPRMFDHESIKEVMENMDDNNNPFIIEGQLYCDIKKESYSIKYVSGHHLVKDYDLMKIPVDWVWDETKDIKIFIPNRLPVTKIIFQQYWKPQIDEFCQNMEVLVPAAYIFMGFERNKNKGENDYDTSNESPI